MDHSEFFQSKILYIVTTPFSCSYTTPNNHGKKLQKLCSPKVLSMPKSLILYTKLALQQVWSPWKTGNLPLWGELP